MKKILIISVIIVIAFLGWYFWNASRPTPNIETNTEEKPISEVSYLCDGNKTIEAAFYKGSSAVQVQPGEPPVPTGSVSLTLSDGRKFNLPQTISGSGIRYANSDESFIFWGKGNGAFITENNEQTYGGCVITAKDPGGLPQVYSNGAMGFSIRYPAGYSVDTSYKYQALGPGKDIDGIKFIIPASIASGTNLSSYDTGLSVEEVPDVQDCNAGIFVYPGASVQNMSDNNVDYSLATTSDAGAGNFYEEKVWAISGTNPCVAVRYFIHYTNIGNYDPGTIKEFDRSALMNQFDQMRRTLILD